MTEFINVLKKILLKIKQDLNQLEIDNININWELIKTLNNYDIVLVKMTDKEIEERLIQPPHQIRPFLIESKNDTEQTVAGYYITSNFKNTFFNLEKYKSFRIVLNDKKYNFHRSSLLSYIEEINLPYENIIHYIDKLNKEDIKKLKKYRSLLINEPAISTPQNKIVEIGDIIKDDNNLYIIYQSDNTNYYGYSIKRSNENVDLEENHNYIFYNNRLYYIDYKITKVFNNSQTISIIDRFNTNIVETIKQNKKLLKLAKKENHKNKIRKKTLGTKIRP